MGSSPSRSRRTQVKSISIPRSDARGSGINPVAAAEAWARQDLHERVSELERQLSECEGRCKDAEERAKTAENQVVV